MSTPPTLPSMDVDETPSGSTSGTPGSGEPSRVPKRQLEDNLKWWQPGMFQLLFIYMGRGDCCVVTCPDGKHIIIDCGANQSDHDVNDMSVVEFIRSDDVLTLPGSVQLEVEALILTHPDQDHVSKVNWVLAMSHDPPPEGTTTEPPPKRRKTGGDKTEGDRTEGEKEPKFKPIKIKKVYFSDTNNFVPYPFDSPMFSYRKGVNCRQTITEKVLPEELIRVRLNAEEKKYDKWTNPYRLSKCTKDEDIAGDEFTVLSGVNTSGVNWSVSIIAGGVRKLDKDRSDTDNSNAGSLVVLIKIGEEKALICGDATSSTEKYLLEKYKGKDTIKNLDLIQVPHHGSVETSSTDEFVKLTCPKRAIISVKYIETGNRHPSKTVIDRYKRHAVDGDPHRIQYWVKKNAAD